MESNDERVRRRAHSLYSARMASGADGNAMKDWVMAERAEQHLNESVDRVRQGLQAIDREVLGTLVDDAQLRRILDASKTHKAQPFARLLRATDANAADGGASQVLHNTERACRNIIGDQATGTWLSQRIVAACDVGAFENASSALAEIRALGYLREAGFEAIPIPPERKPTPDIVANIYAVQIVVEVHQKQMNASQAEKIVADNALPLKPGTGGIAFRQRVVFPLGQPKDDETTAENVASKIAGIKPRAKQAAAALPSILWLDLQDEDMWVVRSDALRPVVSDRGEFFSVGLWHGLYGKKGTLFYEGHSVEQRARNDMPRPMLHDGLFAQNHAWSAAVVCLPRSTAICMNPGATNPLPPAVVEGMLRLPWQNFDDAWVDWPGGARSLTDRITDAEALLQALSSRAQWRW